MKKINRKQKVTLISLAIVVLAIVLTTAILPVKEYVKYNYNFGWWNDNEYKRVEYFNRIDFGERESDDYTYRQFGPNVPQTPVLFSSSALKYLPNTNRRILGARGEKSTAVILGMVDCNKKFDFTSMDGEYFNHNYVITTVDDIPIDASMLGDALYSEINGIFVGSQLHFKVYLPDFSKCDEVSINVDFN